MSWAEVKHALNSTLGTDEFSSLDKMIRGGVKKFTENGTFVVPDGVYKILITACAGGRSGSNSGDVDYGSNGGQGGEYIYKKAFSVSPKDSINITVGKGGKATGHNKETPENGKNTVIGQLITLLGGGISGCTGCLPGYYTSNGSTGSVFYGQNSQTASGGKSIFSGREKAFYGGGGASLGQGGQAMQDILAGYGGGGAGAYDNYISIDGGDGIVIIEW